MDDKQLLDQEEPKKKTMRDVVIGSELGNIYFDYDVATDTQTTLRIMKIQNGTTVTCMINNDPSNMKKFNLVELKKTYKQLLSNYIMAVSRVTVGETSYGIIEDIVIMIYKHTDSDQQFHDPDIICRAGVSDIFYEPYCTDRENPMVGISVTPETCPAGYEFKHFYMALDRVLESKIINLYMIDTLDTIIKLIGKKWDEIPRKLLIDRHNFKMKNDFLYSIHHKDSSDIPDTVDGYCKDVYTLLKTNNFMYDFYALYRIVEVKFVIEYADDGKEYALPLDQKQALQEIYEVNMEKTMVIPYDYTIDLERVKVPYVMVVDATGVLYFIPYTRSKNEYVRKVDTTVIDVMNEVNQKLDQLVNLYNKYSE